MFSKYFRLLNSIFWLFVIGLSFNLQVTGLEPQIEDDNNILVLDDETIQEALIKHKYLLVLYYVTWCPHSLDFLTKLPALAHHLKHINSTIQVATLEDSDTFYLHKVTGQNVLHYPTLHLNRHNYWTAYAYETEEERSYQYVAAWLDQQLAEDDLLERYQYGYTYNKANSFEKYRISMLLCLLAIIYFVYLY
uniref:Thioredoxin domain-containing protein n=1 Tax=Ditylenchus dipsaci TaxID=166011 RepID=A0A915CRI2_9BILA